MNNLEAEYFESVPDTSPLPSRQKALERTSNLIYDYAAQLLAEAIAQYAPGESVTWPRKEVEARAYLVSRNAADAPLLAIEAQAAQMRIIDLGEIIIRKADAYWALAARVAGVRSKHLQAIALLETSEEILSYDYLSEWQNEIH